MQREISQKSVTPCCRETQNCDAEKQLGLPASGGTQVPQDAKANRSTPNAYTTQISCTTRVGENTKFYIEKLAPKELGQILVIPFWPTCGRLIEGRSLLPVCKK